jgi:GT2 family glycosyltransferase
MAESMPESADSPATAPTPVEPVISVVISTWNRVDALNVTLDALRRQEGPPFEVIVVDNASTDGTAARIREAYPEVRLIRMPRNEGPIPGRNVGFANARGEILVFLDSDTEPLPGALAAIHRRLHDDPKLGAVNPLQIDAKSDRPWWWWGPIGYPEAEFVDREFDNAFLIEEGANGVRRSVYEEVGGFEERYCFSNEGRDLAARVARAGYSVRYCPEARFRHHREASRPQSNPLYRRSGYMYYEFRNDIWYTWRYYPVGWAFMRFARNLVVSFRMALHDHVVGAWVRGTFDGVVGLGWVLRHRLPFDAAGMQRVISRGGRYGRRSQAGEAAPV